MPEIVIYNRLCQYRVLKHENKIIHVLEQPCPSKKNIKKSNTKFKFVILISPNYKAIYIYIHTTHAYALKYHIFQYTSRIILYNDNVILYMISYVSYHYDTKKPRYNLIHYICITRIIYIYIYM